VYSTSTLFKKSEVQKHANFTVAVNTGQVKQNQTTAAQMKYVRQKVRYTWMDYETNENILKELETEPTLDNISQYKAKWIQHVN
jgi:hypothetical protein